MSLQLNWSKPVSDLYLMKTQREAYPRRSLGWWFWLYGVYYYDVDRRVVVLLPIPLNIIAGVIRSSYHGLLLMNIKSKKEDIWRRGYNAGRKEEVENARRVLDLMYPSVRSLEKRMEVRHESSQECHCI